MHQKCYYSISHIIFFLRFIAKLHLPNLIWRTSFGKTSFGFANSFPIFPKFCTGYAIGIDFLKLANKQTFAQLYYRYAALIRRCNAIYIL